MQKQISIFSIDLGSKFGWSKSVCSLRPDFNMNVSDHGTVDLDKLADDWMRNNYNLVLPRRRVKMNIFEDQIRKLVNQHNFTCFVTEDIFCIPRRIPTFRSLSIFTDVLERIVNNEKQRRLFTLTPNQIKLYISDFGHSDKIGVSEAITHNSSIQMKSPQTATEHEFDSVAIAYSFVQNFLLTPI